MFETMKKHYLLFKYTVKIFRIEDLSPSIKGMAVGVMSGDMADGFMTYEEFKTVYAERIEALKHGQHLPKN